MFSRSTGRYPIVIGIIILTVANLSIWKFNDSRPTAKQVEVGDLGLNLERVDAEKIAVARGRRVTLDNVQDRDHGSIKAPPPVADKGVDFIPIPKKGNIKMGKEEIWDFPKWGEWSPDFEENDDEQQSQDRFQAAPGIQDGEDNSPDGVVGQLGVDMNRENESNIGQTGELGAKKASLQKVSDPSSVDFNAIMKGSQPDTYMRIFGNILKDTITSRKSTPTNFQALRKTYKIPEIERTKFVNCKKVLEGDILEMRKAHQVVETADKIPVLEETYEMRLKDCEHFKKNRGYVTIPLTEEEENYPLAFSIAIYTDIEQAERLLRMIYQPQNLYCIHIDIKAPLLVHRAAYSLAGCFDNVFIASHLDKIKWGDVSVLLPATNCMRDMVRYHRGKWKYFINLTGQEMPLRTNWELVQIAKIFNGSNDIGGSRKRMEMDRVNYRWSHRWSRTYQQTVFYNTMTHKEPDPWNLTFYKGELHGLFSHKMAEYITESEVGVGYLQWCWNTGHPTEHYWNTLNYNKHLKAPGGFEGPDDVAHNYSLNQIARAKHWVKITYGDRKCEGKIIRGICVYGLGDLPWLHTRKELVANKFHLTHQFLAYDCLEERHRNRTMLKDKIPFDAAFYRNLPTVKYGRKDGL